MPTHRDDPDSDERDPEEDDRRRPGPEPSLRDLARRVLKTGAEALSTTREDLLKGGGRLDPKEIASSVAHLTARGREEMLRLLVREVKSYLDALNLLDEAKALVTNYSLEVHASIRLKPVDDAEPATAPGEETPEDEAREVESPPPTRRRRGTTARARVKRN